MISRVVIRTYWSKKSFLKILASYQISVFMSKSSSFHTPQAVSFQLYVKTATNINHPYESYCNVLILWQTFLRTNKHIFNMCASVSYTVYPELILYTSVFALTFFLMKASKTHSLNTPSRSVYLLVQIKQTLVCSHSYNHSFIAIMNNTDSLMSFGLRLD